MFVETANMQSRLVCRVSNEQTFWFVLRALQKVRNAEFPADSYSHLFISAILMRFFANAQNDRIDMHPFRVLFVLLPLLRERTTDRSVRRSRRKCATAFADCEVSSKQFFRYCSEQSKKCETQS